MANTTAATKSSLAQKLDGELTAMAQAQFETREFKLLMDRPLTMAAARFFSIQMVFYNINRRICWAHVQAQAPFHVKQVVWKHEEDELHYDPRGGSDHGALTAKEALLLGVTEEEMRKAEATPLIEAVLCGFTEINLHGPWLTALTASHFLERRNNSNLMRGGGLSQRWRDKVVKDLKVDSKLLVSSNVHVEADMDHSDSIWDTIEANVVDEISYAQAYDGARRCAIMDRAFRVALAFEMQSL